MVLGEAGAVDDQGRLLLAAELPEPLGLEEIEVGPPEGQMVDGVHLKVAEKKSCEVAGLSQKQERAFHDGRPPGRPRKPKRKRRRTSRKLSGVGPKVRRKRRAFPKR